MKRIRLTEQDLHNIVNECVTEVISEGKTQEALQTIKQWVKYGIISAAALAALSNSLQAEQAEEDAAALSDEERYENMAMFNNGLNENKKRMNR